MHRPIVLASLLVAGLTAGPAHAGPASHAAQEAPLANNAAKIKLYCDNPQLVFAVDWPAFENLDYQVLIAGPEGGNPTVPDRAADPAYVSATRTFILTGNQQLSDLPGGPIGGRGGLIVETFEILCRDHAELRGAAAKITKIVLEPINDMKYQSDRDAIAFARKTNDWSGVQNAMNESTRHDDEEVRRIHYLRWALRGSTLTVTFNVMGHSGVADDYVKVLSDLLDHAGPSDEAPPARPAKDRRRPVAADQPGRAPQCPKGDRKCAQVEAAKAKRFGPAINCEQGPYAGVADYVETNDYTTGAFVSQQWAAEPVQIYRCTSGSGCHKDDHGPGGNAWSQIGHCSQK